MSETAKDALMVVGAFSLAAALFVRYPAAAVSLIEYLSAEADAAKKSQQADNNLLGNGCLPGSNTCPSQKTHGTHYQHQGAADHLLTLSHSGFRSLAFFHISSAPSMSHWSELFNQGCKRNDDFFMIGDDSFCLVVKNTFFGRVAGRCGVVHARFLSRLKLWNSDRKGGRA